MFKKYQFKYLVNIPLQIGDFFINRVAQKKNKIDFQKSITMLK